jgi:hypothetical protein
MSDQRVDCTVHGPNLPAIACQHLCEGGLDASVYIGWVQAQFDPNDRELGDLMAWCGKCDEIYEGEGGWNESSELRAGFRVVCEQCFWGLRAAQDRLQHGAA